jgi:hypothetical protein
MSQKSSVPQAAKSVSQALIRDTRAPLFKASLLWISAVEATPISFLSVQGETYAFDGGAVFAPNVIDRDRFPRRVLIVDACGLRSERIRAASAGVAGL